MRYGAEAISSVSVIYGKVYLSISLFLTGRGRRKSFGIRQHCFQHLLAHRVGNVMSIITMVPNPTYERNINPSKVKGTTKSVVIKINLPFWILRSGLYIGKQCSSSNISFMQLFCDTQRKDTLQVHFLFLSLWITLTVSWHTSKLQNNGKIENNYVSQTVSTQAETTSNVVDSPLHIFNRKYCSIVSNK